MTRIFWVLVVVVGLAACNDNGTIKATADSLKKEVDTLAGKIKESQTIDSLGSKGGRLLDSVKKKGGVFLDSARSKGGRILKKGEESTDAAVDSAQ